MTSDSLATYEWSGSDLIMTVHYVKPASPSAHIVHTKRGHFIAHIEEVAHGVHTHMSDVTRVNIDELDKVKRSIKPYRICRHCMSRAIRNGLM